MYAKELAKNDNKVFWINEPIRNPLKYLFSLIYSKNSKSGVRIYSPFLLVPTLYQLDRFNSFILKIQLFFICGNLNSEKVVLWSVYCAHFNFVISFKKAYRIYWPGDIFDPEKEKKILTTYNLIMPLSECALQMVNNLYSGITILSTTGCDWELFDRTYQKKGKGNNFSKTDKKTIGYVGNISSFRLDFNLLLELARNNNDWIFQLFGPVENDEKTTTWKNKLSHLSNVQFLGEIKYVEVPIVISGFEVGIIPYLESDFNLGTNPNKFFEYAAIGVPCVSTPIPSLTKFSEVIEFGNSSNDWSLAIKNSFNIEDSKKESLREIAKYHSPKESISRIDCLISETH